MLDLTVRALAWMLRIWLPDSRGRHRAGSPVPPPAPVAQPVTRPHPHPHPQPPTPAYTLDERVRRRATRGLRERRRALYLASLGLDTEPPVSREVRVPGALVGATR
ncbi:hypothetical protein ACFZC6_13870 [Streptomyces ossamyceticus]|uniref:hypothetical protein n=1 Tax=Streptomyces ossamyceticus TaxID=249581 RepID=UPI0036F12F75